MPKLSSFALAAAIAEDVAAIVASWRTKKKKNAVRIRFGQRKIVRKGENNSAEI